MRLLCPARRTVEWATAEDSVSGQRAAPHGSGCYWRLLGEEDGRPVAELSGGDRRGRSSLRRLVRRGAVRLETESPRRDSMSPRGSGAKDLAGYEARSKEGATQRAGPGYGGYRARRASRRGGRWRGRPPRRGEQALVLAPEIGAVEHLVETFAVDYCPPD